MTDFKLDPERYAGHTEGPWASEASTPPDGVNCWFISGPNEYDGIADVHGPQSDNACQANALLILDAPEILAHAVKQQNRIGELEAALHRIQQWCDAYPVDTFTPMTEDETEAAVKAAGEAAPSGSERLHASWARHLLKGVRGYTEVLDND